MSAPSPGIEVGNVMGRLPRTIPIVRVTIMAVLSALLVVNHYGAPPQDGDTTVEASDAGSLHDTWWGPWPGAGRSRPGAQARSTSISGSTGPLWDAGGVSDRRDTSSPSRSRRESGGGSPGSTGSTTTDSSRDDTAVPAGRTKGGTETVPRASSPSRGRELASGRGGSPTRGPRSAAGIAPRDPGAMVSRATSTAPHRPAGREHERGEKLGQVPDIAASPDVAGTPRRSR
jgi:hypothetical protein